MQGWGKRKLRSSSHLTTYVVITTLLTGPLCWTSHPGCFVTANWMLDLLGDHFASRVNVYPLFYAPEINIECQL